MMTSLSSLSDIDLEKKVSDKELSHADRDAAKVELAQRGGGSMEHADLHDALMHVQDMMLRASIKWVLVGDLAEQVYSTDIPLLSADLVEVVVMRNQMARSALSMLQTVVGDHTWDDKYFKWEHKGVPIEVKVIDGGYGVFDNPEKTIYTTEEVWLPNPFHVWLNIKDKIR